MSSTVVDHRPPVISRRAFLKATGVALSDWVSLFVARFTSIADELAAPMRTCTRGIFLSCYAAA